LICAANCSGVLADDQRAGVLDALAHRRVFQRLLHAGADLVDHFLRQALGAEDAVVGHAVHRLQAHFLEGRHVRQRGQALRRGHHDGDQAAFP
jgi:hypothetical protein